MALVDDYTESLWARAVSHGVSAKELVAVAELEAAKYPEVDPAQMVFNGRHSASIHLLIGFSLELFLKTALLALGGTAAEAEKYGHRLIALREACEQKGFAPEIAKLKWVVERIHPVHVKHHFRYGSAPKLSMPSLEDTFEVLDGLYAAVGMMVYGPPGETASAK